MEKGFEKQSLSQLSLTAPLEGRAKWKEVPLSAAVAESIQNISPPLFVQMVENVSVYQNGMGRKNREFSIGKKVFENFRP